MLFLSVVKENDTQQFDMKMIGAFNFTFFSRKYRIGLMSDKNTVEEKLLDYRMIKTVEGYINDLDLWSYIYNTYRDFFKETQHSIGEYEINGGMDLKSAITRILTVSQVYKTITVEFTLKINPQIIYSVTFPEGKFVRSGAQLELFGDFTCTQLMQNMYKKSE